MDDHNTTDPSRNWAINPNSSTNHSIDTWPSDDSPPRCPECNEPIEDIRDHATGCPIWGMLPKDWW